jgi:phenylacetate-CoA ligase
MGCHPSIGGGDNFIENITERKVMANRFEGIYHQKEIMGLKERETYLNRQLRDIVAHAYNCCKTVKERFDGAGLKPSDIQTVHDLERLPVLKKSDLPKLQKKDLPFGSTVSMPPHQLRRIYISPGPTYDPYGKEKDPWRMEEAFYSAGFRKGDVVQNAFSYHMTPAGTIFDEALGNLGCVVIPTGVGNIENQIEVLNDLPLTGYTGPAGFLLSLIRKAEELGYNPRTDLGYEVAFTSGDMLTETMRREMEERHGIQVRQGYMTADTGSVAYECIEKAGMHFSTGVVVEIIDPISKKPVSPGEMGEIVVTNFNQTYPLIRFATGDLSFISDGPCNCSRTAPRLEKIVGRADESTKVKAMFIHPHQLQEIVSHFPEVCDYQLIVDRINGKDEMELQIELGLQEIDREGMKTKIDSKFKEVFRVATKVKFIPRGTLLPNHKRIEDRRKWE